MCAYMDYIVVGSFMLGVLVTVIFADTSWMTSRRER